MNNQNQNQQQVETYTFKNFLNEIQTKINQENDNKIIDKSTLTFTKKQDIRHINGRYIVFYSITMLSIILLHFFTNYMQSNLFLLLIFVPNVYFFVRYYNWVVKNLNEKTKYSNEMHITFFKNYVIKSIAITSIFLITILYFCQIDADKMKTMNYIISGYNYLINIVYTNFHFKFTNLKRLFNDTSFSFLSIVLLFNIVFIFVIYQIFNNKIKTKNKNVKIKNIEDQEIAGGYIQTFESDVYNSLITGATGAGKTQLINRIILDRRRYTGTRNIYFDVKGDILQAYFRPGLDVFFDITDSRSVCWDFLQEAEDPAQLKQMMYDLIPEIAGDTNPFFRGSAREKLYNELLKIWQAGKRTNADFLSVLQNPNFDKNENEDVVKTFQEAISNLLFVNTTGKKFNIKYYLRNKDNNQNFNVFVGVNAEYNDIQKPFLTLFLSIINSMIIGKSWQNKNRINIFIDEFANVGKIDKLDSTLSLCREQKIAYFLATQSMKNIEVIYKDKFSNIMDNISNRYSFRTKDNESAEIVSKSYGKHETHEILSSQTQTGTGQSLSQSENIRNIDNVKIEEITNLKNLTYFASFLIKVGNNFVENFIKMHTLTILPLKINQNIERFVKRNDWDQIATAQQETVKKQQREEENRRKMQ